MILDSLRNWAFYCGADSRLKRALEYLAAADLNTLEPGRYEIEGAEIFMKVTEGELKREEEASLEVHDKYIDVQVLIAGEVETMGWRERRGGRAVPVSQCAVFPGGLSMRKKPFGFLQTGRSFSSGSGLDSSSFSVPRTPMLR